MRFGLLGPLVATREDGEPIALPAGKARRVLTALLLSPNTVVSVDRLINAVWEHQPPDWARETVQYFVHKLRKALATGGLPRGAVLVTEAGGYLIQVEPEGFDVARFERLVDQGRAERDAGRPMAAAQTLTAARELWRGPALADVAGANFAEPAIVRLEELRLAAFEDEVDARLALGQHAALVSELEGLVRQHPLRERLCGQLLLALYRSRRQADALAAYRDMRRRFADELGMQLGPDLRRLERAILRQDPALDPPVAERPNPLSDEGLTTTALVAQASAPSAEQSPEIEAGTRATAVVVGSEADAQPVEPARRPVTALVAGLAVPSHDPEVAHGERMWLSQQVADVVARFGGVVHRTPGGNVLVIFGGRHTREDDPERAVRAALGISALNDGDRLRVGVDTGQALLLPDQGRIGDVTGRVLDAAATLQAAAPPGGVLVGVATYRATRRVITYDPAPYPSPAGRGWHATSPRAHIGVAAEVDSIERSILVDRERELEILRQLLERIRSSHEPQLVTLIGEPGIGKTRLVHELGRLVEADSDLIVWRQGRCPPAGTTGDGIFQPLAEIIVSHAGILPTDSSPVATTKLRQAVRSVVHDVHEAATLADRLGALVCQDPNPPTQATDQNHTAALVTAWTHMVEAVAAARPTILVFEDLHGADPQVLDAIGGLVDRVESVPLLVVGTARPELLTRDPAWGGGKRNATSVALGPLTEVGSAALLDRVLDSAGIELSSSIRAAVLAKAAGNPLYVREYVRILSDQDQRPEPQGDRLPIPETLQQVIAARLDALTPGDRDVLGNLAVLGDGNGVDALVAVSGEDETTVTEALTRLARWDLVRRTRRHPSQGRWGYAVRHPLMAEVAYEQLLCPQRADKHQRAAAWLERLGADRADHIERIAYHYQQAITLIQATGTPRGNLPTELAGKARTAMRAAGRQAMALGALGVAARRLRQALAIWPTDDSEHPVLLLELGRALTYSAHTGAEFLTQARDAFVAADRLDQAAAAEAVLGHLARIQVQPDQAAGFIASALARPLPAGPAQVEALTVRAIDLLIADRHGEAIKVAIQVVGLATTLGLAVHEANGRSILSQAQLMAGDPDAIVGAEQALTELDAHGFPMRALAHFGFGHALYWWGDLGRCATAITAGRQVATAADAGIRSWFDALEAGTLYQAGLWSEAEMMLGGFVADGPTGHGAYLGPWARAILGRLALGRGDLDRALAEASAALASAEVAGDIRYEQAARALLGRVLLATEQRDEAAAAVSRLLDDLAADPARGCATTDLGVLLVDLATSDNGEPSVQLPDGLPPTRWHAAVQALASGDLAGAAERLAAIGAHLDEATVRLRLADELAATGQAGPAAGEADQAASIFRKAGAGSDLHRAETILATGPEPPPAAARPPRAARSRR